MTHLIADPATEQPEIGSPESDLDYVIDQDGNQTDVICFKAGKTPLLPKPDETIP